MLADPFLLDRIVDQAILDLRTGHEFRKVSNWAIEAYATRYGSGERIAPDLEIQEEFTRALVAKLVDRGR